MSLFRERMMVSFRMLVTVLVAAVASMIITSGCTTVSTEFTDADGAHYQVRSLAGPFGKLDGTVHQFGYQWDPEGGSIQVGQDASGFDNSGQVAVITALTSALAQAYSGGIFGGVGTPSEGGSGSGTILTRIESLLAEVQSIKERLAALGLAGASP